MSTRFALPAAIATALTCAACGPAPEPLPQKIARAEAMVPADPALAEKYARSCRICHINPDAGAPLAGDAAAWDVRYAKGLPALEATLQNGLNAMPARGQCFDCSRDDLMALTAFMAGRKQ